MARPGGTRIGDVDVVLRSLDGGVVEGDVEVADVFDRSITRLHVLGGAERAAHDVPVGHVTAPVVVHAGDGDGQLELAVLPGRAAAGRQRHLHRESLEVVVTGDLGTPTARLTVRAVLRQGGRGEDQGDG